MEWDIYLPSDDGSYHDVPSFKVHAVNIGELIGRISNKLAERRDEVAGYLQVKAMGSAPMKLAFIDQVAALLRDVATPPYPARLVRCPIRAH